VHSKADVEISSICHTVLETENNNGKEIFLN